MKRQGNTGVWILSKYTDHGTVIATSEWGTNYEFRIDYWERLPEIP